MSLKNSEIIAIGLEVGRELANIRKFLRNASLFWSGVLPLAWLRLIFILIFHGNELVLSTHNGLTVTRCWETIPFLLLTRPFAGFRILMIIKATFQFLSGHPLYIIDMLGTWRVHFLNFISLHLLSNFRDLWESDKWLFPNRRRQGYFSSRRKREHSLNKPAVCFLIEIVAFCVL